MGKIIRKIIILANVFLAVIMIYFIWSKNTVDSTDIVYTTMEEPTLPLVYTSMFGKDMNRLHGYRQEMNAVVARESLTVLPEDRVLNLKISDYGQKITGIRYEIRNLRLDQLVERTSLEEWNEGNGTTTVSFPIQNLLVKGQEYALHIYLDTEQYGDIHYYTRIIWTDSNVIEPMVALAADFSDKILDYDRARDLVTYLESNEMADNSTLGRVTIESSYSQLTWGGLKVSRVGDLQVTLKEVDGIMGQVQVDYIVTHGEGDQQEFFEVRDFYTMKWNEQRIYLMDYVRESNQIFYPKESVYSSKRILLGITNEDQVRVVNSENNQYVTYVVNRDLWSYDQESGQSVAVFSFRNGFEDIRNYYPQNNVRVVSVTDEGDIYFFSYGYMNKGNHEGCMGVAFYKYINEQGALEEKFFIPVYDTYEVLNYQISQLAYLAGNDLLYLFLNQTVYAIDINSNEYMVVAENLGYNQFAASSDGRYIAWQGKEEKELLKINWMDLDTGIKNDINNPNQDQMHILGFVGPDFIYGLSKEADQWRINGRKDQLVMYALEIVDEGLKTETRYEVPDTFLTEIRVADGRVHIQRLDRQADGQYQFKDRDTIVSNEEVSDQQLEGIGWYASKDRGKLFFVQLNMSGESKGLSKYSSPKKLNYDKSEVLKILPETVSHDICYYAYERGRLKRITDQFSEAVAMAYDYMGTVIDCNQRMIWNRVNRRNYMSIDNPATAAYPLIQQLDGFSADQYYNDILMLDARGCTLQQMFYFVDKGIPVIAYTAPGEYLLICGYDSYNITVYDSNNKSTYKIGMQSANDYFEALKNDYICGVFVR